MHRLILILHLFLSLSIYGQKKHTLVYNNDSYQQFIKHPKTEFKDSISLIAYLTDLQLSALNKGYLMASIDSIKFAENNAFVDFNLGKKQKDIQIEIEPSELRFLKKNSRLNEKFISNLPLIPQELYSSIKRIQETYLNNGYPFVSIKLIEHTFQHEQLQAKLNIIRGPQYIWKKINIKGDSSISTKYISNLLDIRKGDIYNESKTKKISARIQQVPYLKELKTSDLLFTKDGSELFLYLEKTPISSINGIIGFQPDAISKKLSVTGELSLKLLDVFKRGELLDVKWQSIRDKTQSLNSHLNYPFLFNTPFGLDGTFDLYKKDTSFLELNSSIGVQYFLNKGNFIKAFYQNTSSSILSGGNNNPSFSKLGNVKSNSYGLTYSSYQVDYLPNPSSGLILLVEGSAGTRKSQLNDTTSIIKDVIYKGDIKIEYYIPVFKRHILKLSNRTLLYNAPEIYENELFRFGGLASQRGFNEDELLATTKSTGSIEYRFLLDKNSHVFAFYDQTWYENNSKKYFNDSPFGFGLGFSFSTKFGVFSISYALGKQFSNPILLTNSKVHFGYIVYF